MRFFQIVIIVLILLGIFLAIVILQQKNKPRDTDAKQPDEGQTDVSASRSAKIFFVVIGVSIVLLCVTVVVFHMLG